MNKTIYLVRHAKSSWNSGVATDFDRPLSHRGERDVARIGDELCLLGWLPERVISSPAIRTKQTCEALCDKLDFPVVNVEWNKEFYAAYMVTLLHSLTALPDSINSAMLIGHNPAMEDLLLHFCSDAGQYQQKNGKLFTTANVARVTVKSMWKDLVLCDATLDKILRPKEL